MISVCYHLNEVEINYRLWISFHLNDNIDGELIMMKRMKQIIKMLLRIYWRNKQIFELPLRVSRFLNEKKKSLRGNLAISRL